MILCNLCVQIYSSSVLFDNFSQAYHTKVNFYTCFRAAPATLDEVRQGKFLNGTVLPENVRLFYVSEVDFKAIAKRFGVMDDFRVC